MGVVEIDERAKMKTKVDELDFGLQTLQSTFWWLDTYQIWWWWGLQKPQSAFWSLTIYRSVVAGLAKMDSITKQQLLEIICVFLEWVFFMGVSIWNGFSVWALGVGIMVALDGHNDAKSNCGRLDL